jgi:UDP-glucose 4-epimerase
MHEKINVLVTGGLGYIGSHVVVELLMRNINVVILDNLSNSKIGCLTRINLITKKEVQFVNGDIKDVHLIRNLLIDFNINAVIHLAGLKSVSESAINPLKYYDINVSSSIIFLKEILNSRANKFIFSSSATVYGSLGQNKYKETSPLNPISVYGKTKLIFENILNDVQENNASLNVFILRYFNPVGAHPSGLIGEDPKGKPYNLMPLISQVAVGKIKELTIYGADWDTLDGTGERDYIHVMDLARGHVDALLKMEKQISPKPVTLNLGTGVPYSVLEVVNAFELVSKKSIPIKFAGRRPGDLSCYYADPTLANEQLGWIAQRSLYQMCEDSWRWQFNNPNGYE